MEEKANSSHIDPSPSATESSTGSTSNKDDDVSVTQLSNTHRRWLKSVVGLGALEAKIWVASGAQLLALMCGVVFLVVTCWLLIIATGAVIAWQSGISLVVIFLSAIALTILGIIGLVWQVKRTLKHMNFTRTLDAAIPTDDEED